MCINSHDKLLENLGRMSERSIRAARGYEPKCKLCNSGYQKEVEYMYECNCSYKDIKTYLEDKGEFLSLMSISRHFRNHYPRRKAYFDNVKTMEDECIQKAIEKYSRLQDIFQDTVREPDYDRMVLNEDKSNFKEYIWKERSVSDVFLNDNGYCLTDHRFCNNIPKKEALYMEDVVSNFNIELSKLNQYSFNESKKLNLLKQKIKCLECRDITNTIMMEYMMHLLLKNIFKIDLDYEKFKEIFHHEAEWDFTKMDNMLNKMIV